MIDWLKRRFDQEGLLITLVIAGLVIFWLLKTSNKQVNNADYKGATIGQLTNNYSKGKRFTPFVEAYGGTNSDSNHRAEVGARVGVRVEF